MAANPSAVRDYNIPRDQVAYVLSRLEAVKRQGTGWLARCPAHSDEDPSLSIRAGRDGRVLVKCFAGCPLEQIVSAAGIAMRDLFPVDLKRAASGQANAAQRQQPALGSRRVVKTTDYLYRDTDGRVIAIHRRRDFPDGKKAITWHHPNGRSCKSGEIPISSLPLYHLPELLAAPADKPVIIAEGEKATDALRDQGLVAVSLPGGASQKDFGKALQALTGRDVILWPDNDDQGRGLMNRIGIALLEAGIARSIRWFGLQSLGTWRAASKDDAFDYFTAGGTTEALAPILKSAPVFKPAPLQEDTTLEFEGLVCLADVQPEQVTWLWPGRIPLGKLTIVDGDPGLGKSIITCDLAARVSTGRSMPDDTVGEIGGPAGVIFLSAEDGLADTIRPRLDAAGADVSRIGALKYVGTEADQRLPTLTDLDAIRNAIERFGAKLVIIDPVMAHLPDGVNPNHDHEVRRALASLVALAEEIGVAILIIRHLNKAVGTKALYRGGGSIGFIGAARSGLVVAPDPQDESGKRRILAYLKCNLADPPPSLAYHIESADNGAARVAWDGTANYQAEELLHPPEIGEPHARAEAVEFLADYLAAGGQPAGEVKAAAQSAGISEPTLQRAKRHLGIRAKRVDGLGKDGHWIWELPGTELQDAG